MSLSLMKRDLKKAKNYLVEKYDIPFDVVNEDFNNMFYNGQGIQSSSSYDYGDGNSNLSYYNTSTNTGNKSSQYKDAYLEYLELNGTDYLYDPDTRTVYDFHDPSIIVGKLTKNMKIVKKHRR